MDTNWLYAVSGGAFCINFVIVAVYSAIPDLCEQPLSTCHSS